MMVVLIDGVTYFLESLANLKPLLDVRCLTWYSPTGTRYVRKFRLLWRELQKPLKVAAWQLLQFSGNWWNWRNWSSYCHDGIFWSSDWLLVVSLNLEPWMKLNSADWSSLSICPVAHFVPRQLLPQLHSLNIHPEGSDPALVWYFTTSNGNQNQNKTAAVGGLSLP